MPDTRCIVGLSLVIHLTERLMFIIFDRGRSSVCVVYKLHYFRTSLYIIVYMHTVSPSDPIFLCLSTNPKPERIHMLTCNMQMIERHDLHLFLSHIRYIGSLRQSAYLVEGLLFLDYPYLHVRS